MNLYNNPEQYSHQNSLQHSFVKNILKEINFNDGSLLDLGCGDGSINEQISSLNHNLNITATDVSPKMIDFATQKYISNLSMKFLVMDASKNIFRDKFNIITSFNCLHWVKEQEKALNGIFISAKKNAQICLLLSHKRSIYHDVIDIVCASKKWRAFFDDFSSTRTFFSYDEYMSLLLRAKLKVNKLTEITKTFAYNSPEKFEEFFCVASSHSKHLPDNLKSNFFNDFFDVYKSTLNIKNEEIPVSFWCLQVLAEK